MKKKGFTIIELLVVISIIVLLVGILAPGVRKAKQTAQRLGQRCQLRNLEVGLEQWYNDHGQEYPDSRQKWGGTHITTGAHQLTEALIGRDAHGFDEQSSWNAEVDEENDDIYAVGAINYYDREELYVELDANAYAQIAQIYDYGSVIGTVTLSPYPGDYDENAAITGKKIASVFTDVWKRKKVITPEEESIRVGMPILYYKAKNTDLFDSLNPINSVFNYQDNWAIMMLGDNVDFGGDNHPFYAEGSGLFPSAQQPAMDKFYDWLINPVVRNSSTPYNKDTYLLLSAGPDGLYGTNDDVHNISNKR